MKVGIYGHLSVWFSWRPSNDFTPPNTPPVKMARTANAYDINEVIIIMR